MQAMRDALERGSGKTNLEEPKPPNKSELPLAGGLGLVDGMAPLNEGPKEVKAAGHQDITQGSSAGLKE